MTCRTTNNPVLVVENGVSCSGEGSCRGDKTYRVGHTGLEPVTSCVSCKRASQLRQWPMTEE